MDVHHPFDSGCVVNFSFTACSGHHVSSRLLSLHSCNEYLSLPNKKNHKNCPSNVKELRDRICRCLSAPLTPCSCICIWFILLTTVSYFMCVYLFQIVYTSLYYAVSLISSWFILYTISLFSPLFVSILYYY